MLLYEFVSSTIHEKKVESHDKTRNLKYQLPRRMKNLNYLTDHILYQKFNIKQ